MKLRDVSQDITDVSFQELGIRNDETSHYVKRAIELKLQYLIVPDTDMESIMYIFCTHGDFDEFLYQYGSKSAPKRRI